MKILKLSEIKNYQKKNDLFCLLVCISINLEYVDTISVISQKKYIVFYLKVLKNPFECPCLILSIKIKTPWTFLYSKIDHRDPLWVHVSGLVFPWRLLSQPSFLPPHSSALCVCEQTLGSMEDHVRRCDSGLMVILAFGKNGTVGVISEKLCWRDFYLLFSFQLKQYLPFVYCIYELSCRLLYFGLRVSCCYLHPGHVTLVQERTEHTSLIAR